MTLKRLFYLLDAAGYPLFVALAFRLSRYVDFGGSDAMGHGVASGFGALLFAMIGVVVCFIASLIVSN